MMMTGGRLIIPRDDGHTDPAYVAQLMEEQGATVMLFGVPALCTAWLQAIKKRPAVAQRLRFWSVGGEAVPPTMLQKVYEVSGEGGAGGQQQRRGTSAALRCCHWGWRSTR